MAVSRSVVVFRSKCQSANLLHSFVAEAYWCEAEVSSFVLSESYVMNQVLPEKTIVLGGTISLSHSAVRS